MLCLLISPPSVLLTAEHHSFPSLWQELLGLRLCSWVLVRRGDCGSRGGEELPKSPSFPPHFSSPLLNKSHSLPYCGLVLSECWWKVIK